uniref:Uncharacterized protein n=1 Tax=Hyaloperonospora arabidopsidis (strain Emoy2) TaxID=559515 RepID=M4B3C2_HYAAE
MVVQRVRRAGVEVIETIHHDSRRCCGDRALKSSKRLAWSVNTNSWGQVHCYRQKYCMTISMRRRRIEHCTIAGHNRVPSLSYRLRLHRHRAAFICLINTYSSLSSVLIITFIDSMSR